MSKISGTGGPMQDRLPRHGDTRGKRGGGRSGCSVRAGFVVGDKSMALLLYGLCKQTWSSLVGREKG